MVCVTCAAVFYTYPRMLHYNMSNMSENNTCQTYACAIQDCLKENGYNESKCTSAINELYKCCREFYEREGPDAQSVCCPKFNLLQLKMKQRQMKQIDAKRSLNDKSAS